ncbi:unnamed protein product [Gongylonema pulchrum]|uniref:TPR_REGION domain-containing protein n=1 Tax=Gongylonema pulchrum TaxID=637853 RepID=A0A183CV23_9BILA|nr:unnamed protein product [Gongylonema pulchrum]
MTSHCNTLKNMCKGGTIPGTYVFEQNNPYLHEANAFENGLQALRDGLLAKAILYFEAAVQQNSQHFEVCLVKLAVAALCINKAMEEKALDILEQWVKSHPMAHLIMSKREAVPENSFESLLTRAKKVEHLIRELSAKSAAMDRSVFHNALSLVFHITNEYDRAAEEIRAAIACNPEVRWDSVLWNRLGATLANGAHAAEAVDAYGKALRICPGYTRARYNLGIACTHLKNYRYVRGRFKPNTF